mgnify:CR=1 FL=1
MLGKLGYYVARVSIFLIVVALVAGMTDCRPVSQNLEIRTWYDLNAVRNDLSGHQRLMNDLDSTTPGYEELASETANLERAGSRLRLLLTHLPGLSTVRDTRYVTCLPTALPKEMWGFLVLLVKQWSSKISA